jgi:hypothetical protein
MVTDAVTERPQVETASPYPLRLLLTLAVLALYWFGHRIPLPFVDPGIAKISPEFAPRISVLALELYPLWTGFFLVELFAVATSAGRRLRRSGEAGRARLNRAGLITSLALAALQAAGVAMSLENMAGLAGVPVVLNPGIAFSLLTIVTLTAATAALYAAGQFLSARGIGNGFALLTLVHLVGPILKAVPRARQEIAELPGAGLGLVAALALAVVAFRFIRKAEDQWTPAFPQSIVPALALPWLWPLVGLLEMPRAAELVLGTILILLLSGLGFHLLSSRPRLEASLSEPGDVLDGAGQALRRQAVPAALLLTLGTVVLLAWQEYQPSRISFAATFPGILMLLAIGLDLWDQYRFERRHGGWVFLARLDDVHLSYLLEERLQEEEIAAIARGHQLRSLLFWFGVLYKIDVMVPEEQLGRAREVMTEVQRAREIKAF